MATQDDLNQKKTDALVALLTRVETLSAKPAQGQGTYDALLKTAQAYRQVAGGEQPRS